MHLFISKSVRRWFWWLVLVVGEDFVCGVGVENRQRIDSAQNLGDLALSPFEFSFFRVGHYYSPSTDYKISFRPRLTGLV